MSPGSAARHAGPGGFIWARRNDGGNLDDPDGGASSRGAGLSGLEALKARRREFVVVRAKLGPRSDRNESHPIIVEIVDPRRADQRRRDKRLKALAIEAFKNWRPGL